MNQTLDISRYEIIVITNFHDDGIENLCKRKKIRYLISNRKPKGEFLYEAIKHSKGSVISLLDDDDLFLPNKLEVLNDAFEDENLIYFHNALTAVDELGNSIDFSFHTTSIKIIERENIRVNIPILFKEGGYFNSSSTTFRKKILNSRKYKYQNISSPDSFIFYVSLCSICESQHRMRFTKRILTRYRFSPRIRQYALTTYINCKERVWKERCSESDYYVHILRRNNLLGYFTKEFSRYRLAYKFYSIYHHSKRFNPKLSDYIRLLCPPVSKIDVALLSAAFPKLIRQHLIKRRFLSERKFESNYEGWIN